MNKSQLSCIIQQLKSTSVGEYHKYYLCGLNKDMEVINPNLYIEVVCLTTISSDSIERLGEFAVNEGYGWDIRTIDVIENNLRKLIPKSRISCPYCKSDNTIYCIENDPLGLVKYACVSCVSYFWIDSDKVNRS